MPKCQRHGCRTAPGTGAKTTEYKGNATTVRSPNGPTPGHEAYGYGPDNRRIYQVKLNGSSSLQEIVTFWSGGKRAGRYELVWSGTASFAFRTLETNVYFGGKPLKLGTQTNVATDRLVSSRISFGPL